MSTAVTDQTWFRKALAVIVVLALLSPVFGWAAEAVGYAEPIDLAAEQTGAADEATGGHGLFSNYSVPGTGGAVGTLLSAVVGIGLMLVVTIGLGRLLER